jgi:hypothetical protein
MLQLGLGFCIFFEMAILNLSPFKSFFETSAYGCQAFTFVEYLFKRTSFVGAKVEEKKSFFSKGFHNFILNI